MIDTILLALLALTGLGTAGVFIYTDMIYKKPLISDSVQKEALIEDVSESNFGANTIEIKKKIINIKGRRGRLRFLDMKISLVPFNKTASKASEAVENKRPEISDIIIEISSKMTPEDLNSISGKILLENRLKKRINNALGDKLIKKILFTRFVIQ